MSLDPELQETIAKVGGNEFEEINSVG